MRLTEVDVPKLRPGVHMDDRLTDFGIRVGKGRRSWIIVKGRGRVKTTIGRYPDMPLKEARDTAKKLLANDDPARTRISFAHARDEFLERYENENTKYQVERSLKRHCTSLETMQLADIDDANVKRILDKIGDRPSEQLHLFRYLRAFFRWAQRSPRRYIRHSPMEGYEAPGRDKRKARILTDDELKAVWSACETPQEQAVRLMLLWGTRRGETAVLERSWASGGVFTIPGEATKNGRAHAIPICPLAEHVLSTSTSNQYQFPGRWGGHLTPRGLSQIVEDVRKRSGTSGWTPHDLRRTFRSLAARVGVSRDIAELLMNHAPPVLDDIYDRHSYLPEKRAALLRIEHFLVWLLARG